MKVRILTAVLIFAFALLLFCPTQPKADTLKFEYSYVFTGDTPAGDMPWLTAEFLSNGAGTVTLTLQTHFGTTGQKVGEWDFNVNPFTSLTILPSSTNPIIAKSINVEENAFKGDGDGYFDIEFLFNPANSKAFKGDMTVQYTITGIGITVNSFYFLSSATKGPNGGDGTGLPSIAHVQSIPGADSGWVIPVSPVPEPATMFLLGSGLIGLAGFARRRFKR